MKQELDLRAIASQIKAAQDRVWSLDPITARWSGFDVASAYAVARLIHEARLAEGAVPAGRKIGFTNPEMWSAYGVHEPIWAYVYDTTVAPLPGPHTTCGIGRFAEPKIEPEIVLHFSVAPPVGGNLSAILECIDWIAHGFEIAQSHFPGWKFQAADTIADSGLHGTLLIGEPQPVGRLGPDPVQALERFSVTLSCDGAVRDTGRGSNVLGNPLAAIAHLTALLAQQQPPAPLQTNELVTTGTLTAAFPIQPGQTWSTDLEGIALPGISVQFLTRNTRAETDTENGARSNS